MKWFAIDFHSLLARLRPLAAGWFFKHYKAFHDVIAAWRKLLKNVAADKKFLVLSEFIQTKLQWL